MSIRFRESAGTSWQDPYAPGVRHWRSRGISYGLFGWLMTGFGWVLIGLVVAVPWMAVETAALLTITAVAAVIYMIAHKQVGTPHLVRWGPFHLIDVDLEGGRNNA